MVDPEAHRYCAGSFHLPGSSFIYREYHNEHHGAVDLDDAIASSCDVYFYGLANEIGVDRISAFMAPFGFGELTGIDISGEKAGILPSRDWKEKMFSRPADRVWFPGETVSFGIGQGYLTVTPLELAHYASVVASRGRIWKPRLVAAYRDPGTGQVHAHRAGLGGRGGRGLGRDWQRVVHGMIGVTQRGTASRHRRARALRVCRQDRHRAGVHRGAQREVQRARSTSGCAIIPGSSPSRRRSTAHRARGAGGERRRRCERRAPIARKVLDAYLLDAEGKVKPTS